MRAIVSLRLGLLAAFVIALVYLGGGPHPVLGQEKAGAGVAAVPGTVGGQDMFGPYDLVAGWPKDISTLAGHEKWTWGAAQSIFAESPNRVYMLHRGELPVLGERPQIRLLPELGPSIQFPIN